MLWSFAALGYTPDPSVLNLIWQGSVQGLTSATSPQTLATMVWAAATLEVAPSVEWMGAWTAAAAASLSRWKVVDVAMALWALGRFAGAHDTR